jgi:hypothetical protein
MWHFEDFRLLMVKPSGSDQSVILYTKLYSRCIKDIFMPLESLETKPVSDGNGSQSESPISFWEEKFSIGSMFYETYENE